jgi:non-heme chloroperoxidase
MPTITTADGTQIFYKDWGSGPPIVFSHGWPLSSDDWDAQLMFFADKGFRVIAHDRRGHGRSTQTWGGNDMDTYADDLFALVEALDLKNVVHIGHSTGGGEVVRYLARHPSDRAVAGVLACAVPPLMLKTAANPDGAPIELFDGFRAQLLANRAEFYREVTIPFYGYNRPGAKISEGLREKWWLQGMLGSVKAGYDCIKAFSETDFTEDLKKIQIPMLVLHSKDDQIVPIAAAGPRSAELLPNATLKIYEDLPHGLPATAADVFNADVLAFLQKAIPQVIGAAAKATA